MRGGVRQICMGVAMAALSIVACADVLGIQSRSLDPQLGDSGAVDSGAMMVVVDAGAGDAGACGDLQSNGDNCGRCGHSCLGGGCEAGVCQPVVLASKIQAWDVAVDSTSVYWTQPADGLVMKADKVTGKSSTVLLSSSSNGLVVYPRYIAIDEENLYVVDFGTGALLSCAINGCGSNPTQIVAFPDAGPSGNQDFVGHIALHGSFIYFSDSSGSVWRVPKIGGEMHRLSTYDPILDSGINVGTQSSPEALTVDDKFVYFTNDDGTVRKTGLDGGPAELIGTGPVVAWGNIAVNNGNVFFDQIEVDPGGAVEEVPLSGGMPILLVASQHNPFGITADSNFLYWVTEGAQPSLDNGTVMMCSPSNCASPTQLASGQLDPIGIAIDDGGVYWANNAFSQQEGSGQSGAVQRVAKP